MKLCEALTFYKNVKQMSFEEIHAKSALPVSTLKKMFGGVTASPSFDAVCVVAAALGISIQQLDDKTKEDEAWSLSAEAAALAYKYEQLDAHGRRVVDFIAGEELARMRQDAPITRAAELHQIGSELTADFAEASEQSV